MKVISGFKDYYDFMVATYGVDPLLVYERIPHSEHWEDGGLVYKKTGLFKPLDFPSAFRDDEIYEIAFCGKLYTCHFTEDKKIYYPDQDPRRTDKYMYMIGGKEKKERQYQALLTDVNDKYDCPIMVSGIIGNDWHKNPRLSDFKFSAVVSADECWRSLVDFFSKRRDVPIVDKRTDVMKIESKGFDKKISFRHRKKEA